VSTPSAKVIDDVLGALHPSEGQTPKEVHERVGRWSRVTIRHTLIALCADGRARFTGPDSGRLYFKVEP